MSEQANDRLSPETLAAQAACVDHARDLLTAAIAVQQAGKPNIAYHLAALALEECGRRELIGMQSVSTMATTPPTWFDKHSQDHVKKLFWCFFGSMFLGEKITKQRVEEMRSLAQNIHFTRLAGLYVSVNEDGLGIPRDAIGKEEAQATIDFAAAHVDLMASAKVRENIAPEEVELQRWFMGTIDDPEKRKLMMGNKSLDKLAELKGDAQAWGRWLKSQFDNNEAEMQALMQAEIDRGKALTLPAPKAKDKWKLRVRLYTSSHSIRQKELNAWNDHSDWIKLTMAAKDQLYVDFILGDNVPLQGLWYYGWGLARHFAVALNIGTLGHWWWHMPKDVSRYYERLDDLESKVEVKADRTPILKVNWGNNRVLTAQDIMRVGMCFAMIPPPLGRSQRQQGIYDYYIGGVTFLSLNDIHWQCEGQAFGNFYESLKAAMSLYGEWDGTTPFAERFFKHISDRFPNAEDSDRQKSLAEAYDKGAFEGVTVNLQDVAIVKTICDHYVQTKLQAAAQLKMAKRPTTT